jgi:RNA polymerase sigma-70 factor (ECF subfamily)
VQDAFLRLCRQDPERIQGQVVAWLYRVCRNRALDVLSKERRMSQLSPQQAGDCRDRRGDPTAAMERREDAALAAELLQQLPERQREVIRLKVEEELSYREIAEVLEISVSNVGFLLHVGFKTLRQRLGPRLAPGEP